MRRLDRYIASHVLGGAMLVLMILVGLFSFLTFIEEVDEIGKAQYGTWQAVQFVLWQIPLLVYELFPTALLIGSLFGLGILANNSELTVMRAAGISTLRIAVAALQAGLLLIAISMVIGETLAPYGEQHARQLRSTAQAGGAQMVFQSRYGFWARDGSQFINIRTILPDGGFGGVTIYQLTETLQPQSVTQARRADYTDDGWMLSDVQHTDFSLNPHDSQQIRRTVQQQLPWQAVLEPDLVKMVVVRPHKLSTWGLYQYIHYLQQSGQQAQQYALAFWQRLAYPLTSITMILLALPFVFGSMRSVSISQRIIVGALIGVCFHTLNQVAGHMGLVYAFPPLVSAVIPPLLFLSIAIWLLVRKV